MSITSIVPGVLAGIASADPVQASTSSGPTSHGTSSTGGMSLSPRSQFLSKLMSLVQSNPAQAQKEVAALAAKLSARAAQEGGAAGARTSALAQRLEQAATSGDYSSLFDGGSSGGGAHAMSSGAGAYAALATTRSS